MSKNGGYRCGFFYLSTCGKGSISANKLVLNSYHNYASALLNKSDFG
ncbi:Large exoprotein [Klebsiella oxytoca]|nr:Large exoprotein [Klebsiella oxytoca]